MPRETLIDFFRDLTTIRATFLVYDDGYRRRGYTYADVGRAARGFARKLSEHGLRKGDAVIFWGDNRPEWLACYWGCLIAGIVIVPIDFRSSAAFVATVRTLVQARLVLCGDGAQPRHDGVDADGAERWYFSDLDWDADGAMPAITASRDDIVQIIFTSGATSEPKGVVIRHRNVLANVVPVEHEIAKYRRYIRPFHPLRFLNLLPLSHMFGQSMATTIPPMVRGTVIFTNSFNPHDLLRLIRARRVSVLVCVPKILDVLRDHVAHTFPESMEPPASGISIPGRWWKYRRVHTAFGVKFWAFIVGAAALPTDLEEFWRRMGFAVIQGYGLTETAPIVTLNHPFRKNKEGSVGKPLAGVEVRIAEDGEILVRGENVTSGYYVDPARPPSPDAQPGTGNDLFDAGGWLHTGDIGERDSEGRLFIKGRKKEMIVTADGLNVYPEDVERVLNDLPGVRESAVVGVSGAGEERVHAVLVLDAGTDPDAIIRQVNARVQNHQRVRGASVWPTDALPRTDGTRKLKRTAIREWVTAGEQPVDTQGGDPLDALIARFAGDRDVSATTTLDDLGLSSLERVELMVALEDKFQTRIDEARFADVHDLRQLKELVEQDSPSEQVEPVVDFPTWTRAWPVRVVRRLSLATWILPLTRLFAHTRVEGLEHLARMTGPVIFASNHQSHMDVPVILSALPGRWRARLAPAMLKEFFTAHFHPQDHTRRQWLTNSLNYYLACFYFNAFPIPQREAGARHTLHYMGDMASDGWSILIFPEGVRAATGDIKPFRGGVGMIASRLDVPVVPVRLDGLDRVLHTTWRMARPGRVRVAFGAPLQLRGEHYADLARQVEEAVRQL
ncbi:MAG: AMP-binding protein [Acidobacteria bacterium]|nr:AMP-binding protein [Acidobacteriota bacterium]